MKSGKIVAGSAYGELVVIEETNKRQDGKKVYLCLCSCGKNKEVSSVRLKSGATKSCGCLRKRKLSAVKHGYYRSNKVEYDAWKNMIARCTKPKLKSYSNYGGRGITVCDRWLESFENFLEDMGERPSDKHSIDRIDNDGPYSPDNCRWATREVQNHNKRGVNNKTNTPKGVYYSERDDLWTSKITIKGKRIILGYFKNVDNAIEARRKAEIYYLPEVYPEQV